MARWKRKPIAKARQLRRDPTAAEWALWRLLRDRQTTGAKFRRQVPIGGFIADFVAPGARLVIEVDGGQHATDGPERTAALERAGFRVLRFWNNEVLGNPEGVLHRICSALKQS